MTEPRHLFCWFDTEYTTLELERAKLLQVALIVTDDELRPVRPEPLPSSIPGELVRRDGFTAFVTPPSREEMSEHVLTHYQPLLESCERDGIEASNVDAYLAAYMDGFAECRLSDKRKRPALAGNSIYADYFLARKFLPRFIQHLNYRMFDVTTFKLEWLFHHQGEKFNKLGHADSIRKLYRGEDEIAGDKHDAYYDVQASMAELSFYRSRFGKPQTAS